MINEITSSVRATRKSPKAPTNRINWLKDELPDPADQREYAKQRCILVITEAIGEAMERAGLTRADVARQLGTNRSHVTKLLNGTHNMTLHSLSDLLWACGQEVEDLDLVDLGVIETVLTSADEWVTLEAAAEPKVRLIS